MDEQGKRQRAVLLKEQVERGHRWFRFVLRLSVVLLVVTGLLGLFALFSSDMAPDRPCTPKCPEPPGVTLEVWCALASAIGTVVSAGVAVVTLCRHRREQSSSGVPCPHCSLPGPPPAEEGEGRSRDGYL